MDIKHHIEKKGSHGVFTLKNIMRVMVMKNLAVIIPCYNCQDTIKKCINSILNQEYTDFDVFLINDGSIDSTESVIKSFNDIRIKYFYQINSGVSSARNSGLQLVYDMYQYIMFVDSDDWLEKDALSIFMKIMSNDSPDYIFCNWLQYEINGSFIRTMNDDFDKNVTLEQVLFHLLRSRNGGSPWGKLYKMSILKKYNIKFENNLPYAEDYLFNLSYLKYCRNVRYIEKPLYGYSHTEGGAGTKFRKDRLEITLKVEDMKWSLFSDISEVEKKIMLIELAEQLAISVHYYKNRNFTILEKKEGLQTIKKYIENKSIKLRTILELPISYKFKLIYLGLYCGVII